MGNRTILYLHGFLSSGQSTKARYFRERFESLSQAEFHAIDFNPTPRDFEYMTITGSINRLRQYVLDHRLAEMSLIGSSLGGLIGLHYGHRFGGVERMLLLAPAPFWLSGGLSEDELQQWEEAGAAPIFHPAFEKEDHSRLWSGLHRLRHPPGADGPRGGEAGRGLVPRDGMA